MVNIFSCACWQFVYLLWGNVYSSHLLIFKSNCLFLLLLSCKSYLYCLYIKYLSDIGFTDIFFLFHRLPFHSVHCVLWCTKVLSFMFSHWFIFILLPEFLLSMCHLRTWLYRWLPQGPIIWLVIFKETWISPIST